MELVQSHNGKIEPEPRRASYTPLVRADQQTLTKVWPKVREGCLAIQLKDPHRDSASWDVSNIAQQLDLAFLGRSTAELWLIKNKDGGDDGFIVTVVANCPYKQTPQSLVIWIWYHYRPLLWFGFRQLKKARAILAQLEDHGRQLKLEHMDGYSSNMKWLKWLMLVDPKIRCAQFMFRKDLF